MNVNTKLVYAVRDIENIARHDDASLELREAALQRLVATIDHETKTMRVRHRAYIAAQVAALTPKETE